MVCPRCGESVSISVGRCPACGAALVENAIATGVIPIDTTGLPPGASFGAVTSRGTVAVPSDTIEVAVTVAPTQIERPKSAGPLNVGQAFGPRYHIIKLLGIGGMGAVYQAWDAELSVAVALKVIRVDARHADSSEAEKRLKQELLLARQVTHKHVVRIHDIGEIDGIKYITMPYVQGNDLATELRRHGKLPIARALRFARQITEGLQAAHDAGVIHRDLKPANIMVSGGGDDSQALIMDFGISASADQDTSGSLLGTLEYMAPEQATGGAVEGRADIYAFGLIVYEMLTGPRLVAAATPQARVDAMNQRFAEGLVPVRALDSSIPEPLETFVMRCVNTDAAARFQTGSELAAALARLGDDGELLPFAARLTKPMIAAAAAVVLLLLGGTYVGTRRLVTPPKVHDPVSVLIADFDNRAGDPDFNGSLEQALGLAVENASFVTTYRRDAARKIASELRPGSSLDATVGRLVALREGVGVLLSGAIEARGSGYSLTVRAIDPANNKVLTVANASARSKNDVLRAVGTTASTIRTTLGDTTSEASKLAASETVTTASLEALAHYSRAQDFLYNSKDEDAITFYKRAIALDPNLGRAYSGWAISAGNLGRHEEAADAWKKALSLVDRMTEREKYRTLGVYYVRMVHNYEKAIENFSTLVRLYPNDRSGHLNLALAYFYTRNFPKALEEGRRAVEGAPRDLMNRTNYALYAMYAGDFATAAAEATAVIRQDSTFYRAYLPLAIAALAKSDFAGAQQAYEAMAKTGAPGSSVANLGLADVALYQGRWTDAEALLRSGTVDDERQKNTAGMAAKYTALSEAYLAGGKKALALSAAERAMKLLGHDVSAVPAARVLIATGKPAAARSLAAALGEQLQPESRAYGKLLEALVARHDGDRVAASEMLVAAQKLVDLWWARVDLGIAYAEAEHYAEAFGELTQSQTRRGEATAILLDDLPTFRYAAALPYWMGRAEDGLGQREAAQESYKAYLGLRPEPALDALAGDALKRLASR